MILYVVDPTHSMFTDHQVCAKENLEILKPGELIRAQSNRWLVFVISGKFQGSLLILTYFSYLNEFRVEACPLFKQHQCQQHRPYTCFNWHFANQRRRRPQRKSDGSFNYSPDIYCDKYDENTGICPDGDECVYLHRVSGDVERKYHLRYYKTAQCVHPTDSRGQCIKNGAHCAFAHSSADLRQPQFDQHEAGFSTTVDGDGRDRTSFVIEDPLWHSECIDLRLLLNHFWIFV
ncbi:hypothetical protein ANCCAN_11126 [Ancylostoma caninum]|uniref:C3H1-type domain-containing protein n=1 Tax=Ancylostoma caninum TaxID=29170 RepID=A0A368GEW4_ANCCA|nr:hypothetical protein ANCCAN_11126 [Ancylostoma caninum]